MTPTKIQTDIFLEISVYLTGFSKIELLATGMLQTYFNVMSNMNSIPTVEAFLSESADILKKNSGNDQKINAEILARLMPDSLYNGLAKNIITMWYMGNWGNNVINPQTYVQGLIWSTASTHPPGAKQPGYGSWHTAPKNNS
jgi:hypothetical protein